MPLSHGRASITQLYSNIALGHLKALKPPEHNYCLNIQKMWYPVQASISSVLRRVNR